MSGRKRMMMEIKKKKMKGRRLPSMGVIDGGLGGPA
jgi:hypothetical protein